MLTGRIIFPNPFGHKLPSSEEVEGMQEKYGFSDAYADFLKTQNGFKGQINKEFISKYVVPITMTEEEKEEYLSEYGFSEIYGLITGNEASDVRTAALSRWSRLLPYFFPIGKDPAGNPFVEILHGEYKGYIANLDHETMGGHTTEDLFEDNYEDMTEEERIEYLISEERDLAWIIAPSIKEFVECCLCVVEDEDGDYDIEWFGDYDDAEDIK